MKRQTIGLGCTTTSTSILAVAGWGAETVAFTATSVFVDGRPQPHRITEMNHQPCDIALEDAPAVVQEHMRRWG